MKTKPNRHPWPDYCTRETLAARLEVAPAYIDQLEKRGLLPPPVAIGEAKRWRWSDVEIYISQLDDGAHASTDREDPYFAGIERGATEETRN